LHLKQQTISGHGGPHEQVSISKNRQRWCYLDGRARQLVKDDLRPLGVGWHAMRFPQLFLLCRDLRLTKGDLAGLIGYRAYAMAGDAKTLGIYGFGAAAHILAQIAVAEGRTVYAYTRRGDEVAQTLARQLGVAWAGASEETAPDTLDAAIIFAPVGALVPQALAATRKGGAVVCAGIHMSDIPSFPYRILWEERRIISVANLTRGDGDAFFRAATRIRIETTVHHYPLIAVNQALSDLREGRFAGAAVLVPSR